MDSPSLLKFSYNLICLVDTPGREGEETPGGRGRRHQGGGGGDTRGEVDGGRAHCVGLSI